MRTFSIAEAEEKILENHSRVFARPESDCMSAMIMCWEKDRVVYFYALHLEGDCEIPTEDISCLMDQQMEGWICIAYAGGELPGWLRDDAPETTTVHVDVSGIESVQERVAALEGTRVATIEHADRLEMRWRGEDATGSRAVILDADKAYDVRIVERQGL